MISSTSTHRPATGHTPSGGVAVKQNSGHQLEAPKDQWESPAALPSRLKKAAKNGLRAAADASRIGFAFFTIASRVGRVGAILGGVAYGIVQGVRIFISEAQSK